MRLRMNDLPMKHIPPPKKNTGKFPMAIPVMTHQGKGRDSFQQALQVGYRDRLSGL